MIPHLQGKYLSFPARILCSFLMILSTIAFAHKTQAEPDKKPNLNQLYRTSNLPRAHLDFSMFHFVPKGDKIIEQPDQARLIFQTPTGAPDGYGQRRGTSIFYYDASGKAIRIQHLTDEEIERLNHPY